MDFIKKGVVSTKYVADGCEFKKHNNKYKLVSSQNPKYQPFVGTTSSESVWDLISMSDITSGDKHKVAAGLLIDHFKAGQTVFSPNANILLKNGERVIYQTSNNIVLKEPKSIRVTNSAHVGTARRHGKSSFGYGVSTSRGESHDEIKIIATGQIIITNKRFIFSGNNRSIDVNISQITGITPYTDGFKLQRKSKQKPEYFVNLDGNVFNYKINNDTYFFKMNGLFIKAMLEGSSNKTPQKSKLQQIKANPKPQIEHKTPKAEIHFCPNCGTHVEPDYVFCINCGFEFK